MKLDTSTWMMLFFIFFLIISIWKIWAFLPNKQLADDDKTEESTAELKRLLMKIIKEKKGKITLEELFHAISTDEEFDSKLFWRFNLNRLKQLLNNKTIEEFYQERCS
jgi:membrane protein implicated in regulation of membrane protease activity